MRAIFFVGNFLEGSPRTHRHGVILRADKVDCLILRRRQPQPARDRLFSALFGPLALQRNDLNVGWFVLRHTGRAFLGGRTLRWTFNIENRSPAREQRRELLSLDAADLDVIRADRKRRRLRRFVQLWQILRIPI